MSVSLIRLHDTRKQTYVLFLISFALTWVQFGPFKCSINDYWLNKRMATEFHGNLAKTPEKGGVFWLIVIFSFQMSTECFEIHVRSVWLTFIWNIKLKFILLLISFCTNLNCILVFINVNLSFMLFRETD